jgi:hypothetical protein
MSALHDVCKTPPGQAVITLRGGSSALYGFTAFPLEDAPCGAAIFIFARPSDNPLRGATSYWEPLLVGETSGMRGRSEARLERISEARRLGATHMLIHFCGRGTDIRRRIVADLAAGLSLPQDRVLSQPAAA